MCQPIVKTLMVGPLQVNAYLVYEAARDDALVIDPGDEAARIVEALDGRKLAGVVLTHGHFDHIGAIDALAPRQIVIHALDAAMLTTPALNLSRMMGKPFAQSAATRLLGDGDMVTLAGITLEVLHTPGHTAGSICLRCGSALFTGDTMFAQGGAGRTDFPGGDDADMHRSLMRLLAGEGDAMVYPGHGPATTLVAERRLRR
ncbi:MAG: MBL fold metallo-hydrolase [Clostridia bacterium]